MMRKRCLLAHDEINGYHVELPTYQMVRGTFEPIIDRLLHADGVHPDTKPADVLAARITVECIIPDEYCHPDTGKLEMHRVAQHHRNSGLWKNRRNPTDDQ